MNPYESQRALAEYVLFHYGDEREIFGELPGPRGALNFPKRVVAELVDTSALPQNARALDLGCAVGAVAFELAKVCAEVLGVDLSASFIHAAEHLRRNGSLTVEVPVEGRKTSSFTALLPRDVPRERVRFEQADAMNPPESWGRFDLVVAANLLCRLPRPAEFLREVSGLLKPGGQLILTTPFSWLEEFTPCEHWLGGRTREDVSGLDAVIAALSGQLRLELEKAMPFVIREHARKFQYVVAHGMRWRRPE